MPQFLNLIVTLPLFTAGRISSTVKANEARQQQAVAQYLQVIQRAFREVEDALVIHRKAREVRVEQERRVAANRQALFLATLRHERGLATYLDVLDQERQLFQAELSWPRPPAISSRPWSRCTRRWAVDGDCALERWHDRLARTVLPAR